MKIFILLLQIGELLDGQFNWRGLAQLLLLVLMALIGVGFTVFVGYKAFHSKPKK
jgi:hypothetical protein